MIAILGASGGIGSRLLDAASMQSHGAGVLGVFRADCDIESDESVSSWFSGLQHDGPLYVVNATGHLANGYLRSMPMEDADKTVAVNVLGSYSLVTRFCASSPPPGSSLLLLSSVVSRLGVAGAASYGMCKAALHGLVRSAAKEYARAGLRINALELGYFDAGMIERIPKDKRDEIRNSIPLGRFGRVDDLWQMAHAVLTNSYMTGQIVPITGGL